jgi:hypothetical protein
MNYQKKYTGKEFNEIKDFELYAFSKNEIDISKGKKNKYIDNGYNENENFSHYSNYYENTSLRLFCSNSIKFKQILLSNKYIDNDNENINVKYIYKVEILEKSEVRLFYGSNNPYTGSYSVKGKINLLEKYPIDEFFDNYKNCKTIAKDGISSEIISKIPIKNRTYELLFLIIKSLPNKEINKIFNILSFFQKKNKKYEIYKEIAKLRSIYFWMFFKNIPKKMISSEIINILIENKGLEFIPTKYKTYDICLEAVKHNENNIMYVPENYLTIDFFMELIKNNYELFKKPKREQLTKEIINEIVEINGNYLRIIDDNDKDEEIVKLAIKSGITVLKYIPQQFKNYKICETAIENQKNKIKIFENKDLIPKSVIDKKMCEKLAEKCINFLEFIPNKLKDKEICLKGIENFLINNDHKDEIIMHDHPLRFIPKKILTKEFLTTDNLDLKIVKNNPYSLIFIPYNLRNYEICYEAIMNAEYLQLNNIPKKICYCSLEMCVISVLENPRNIHHVGKQYFADTIKKVYKKKPNFINKIINFVKDIDIDISQNLIQEIFLENIYNSKLFDSLKMFIEYINYDFFINNRTFLDKKINEIYNKTNEEPYNVLCKIFDIIIKKIYSKDDYLYIIHGFDFWTQCISRIIKTLFNKNVIYINEHSPKKLKRITEGNNRIFIIDPKKNIGSKQIDIMQNCGKAILLARKKLKKFELKELEHKKIYKLINIINIDTNILNFTPIIDDKLIIDDLIINEDEKSEKILNEYDLDKVLNLLEYKLLYFERYKIMKDKNYDLSLKNCEIPNRYYLKCAKHIPTYLEEIIEYKKNQSITISDINKKLKGYIEKHDKTLSKKITKNIVIDSLLEIKKWKINIDSETNQLLNHRFRFI